MVLIIPGFFTGNTDFHEGGPFGLIPGGFILAAVIDGVLNNQWLASWDIDIPLTILFCIIGFFTGKYGKAVSFWVTTIGISFTMFSLAMYMFAWHDIIIPWLVPIIGYLGSGLIRFAYKTLEGELHKFMLERDYYEEKSKRLEEENKKVALQQSLALGKVVQDLLLPAKLHGQFDRYYFEMKYTPSQVMGGDWIYVWDVGKEERRIIIGDVMGKGPSAAIPVAVIIGVIKGAQLENLSLTDTISRINKRLIDLFGGQITSTMAVAILKNDGNVTFYNAGSPGWYIYGKEIEARFIPLRSNPLGLTSDLVPSKTTIKIEQPLVCFTFTDGYMEGSRAARKLLTKLNKKGLFDDGSQVLHDILMDSGIGHRLEDDRSMLAIKAS